MTRLKLGKLPDRTPAKITINVNPELHGTLREFQRVYRQVYDQTERIEDLIPFMLEAFLAADRGFQKARKALPEQERGGADE